MASKYKSKNQHKGGASSKNTEPLAPAERRPAAPAQQRLAPSASLPHRSLAQRRAEHALDKVKALQAENAYGNYVSYVKALPATIIVSGLGQALAMENAGKKLGHKKLFKHMRAWLCEGWQHTPYQLALAEDDTAFFKAISGGDEAKYIKAQAEALEYLEWLKKFAVAFLMEPEEGEEGE